MLDTLVSIKELAENIDNPGWRILDSRYSLADSQAGQHAYLDSHILGAYYLNLDIHLSNPHVPGKTGRHPLPDKNDWITNVQALGINSQIQVIVYDDAGGAMAARLWWMLRWIGHEKVALLDGGWQAWQKSDLPVCASVADPPDASKADYAALPSLVKTVQAEELYNQKQLLLDARELLRFRGDTEPLDPVAGHIPGALCSPFSANLNKEGFFLSEQGLREKFCQAAESSKPVVCYCGSGVTAAHNILAMKVAGLEEPALYPGSWSDWIADPTRPVATGGED